MGENAPAHSGQKLRLFVRRWTVFHIVLLAVAYVALLAWTFPGFEALLEAWIFLPVGIFGAVVANSTGTGGGVVFVPAFAQLDIRPPQSIAMSFLIQSFGMSVGTLVWLNAFYGKGKVSTLERLDPNTMFGIITIVLATCLPALLLIQWVYFRTADQATLLFAFKVFSIILGLVLFAFTILKDPLAPKKIRRMPSTVDNIMLVLIGLTGGVVTALFSVGVGEFLAIYLIFRQYPTVSAIVCAVIVSVISVLTGVWYHIANMTLSTRVDEVTQTLVSAPRWEVVILAIPGALIGGYMASLFATLLGTQKLKIFASLWIILSALYLLVQGLAM